VPDDPSEAGDSDLRRRAAWLLGLIVLVAVLLVLVMTTVLKSDKHGSTPQAKDPITDVNGASSAPTGPSSPPLKTRSPDPTQSSSSTASEKKTCPTDKTCTFDTDIGNAIPAINDYREQNGMSAVPGSVSDAAKQCALNRGDGCDGGWAETEISAPANGKTAVDSIQKFAKFLDPGMKSIDVGWAYNPGTKTYYFATIRQD
jgi:hypothetical protein